MDEVQTIDLSCEDNGLLNSFFSEHEQEDTSFKLLEDVQAISLRDISDNFQRSELLPQPSESLEPERIRKNGKCNMRKSLAWDSAFFTSAGFLEPEELSSMLEGGVDKVRKNVLPGIEEDDIRRSIDTISTLESDSLTLESLEADLFQDIRASIQRSSKASSAKNTSNQARSAEKPVRTIQSLRTPSLASQNKPKLISKRPSSNTQGPGKLMKESSISQQVTQPAARGGGSAPSHPQLPKALGRACTISTAATKRASLGPNRVKMEKDNSKSSAVAGRGGPLSRTPGLGGSRSSVPQGAQSLKISSSGSSTAIKTEPTTSCSSLDSSSSVSSRNVGKSTSKSMNRIPVSKAVKPSSSGPKIASRSNTQQGNSHLSAYLKSATKPSCSKSSASSISEWSCESSSSTSTTKQRFSNAKASLGSSSPCKGVSADSDSPHAQYSLHQSNGQFSVGPEIQGTGLQSQCVNEAVMGTGASACQASAKPSGLRMPSPKIGFFDGVKSVARTPKGGLQSHSGVPSSLHKSGPIISSPSGGPSNTKFRKLQPASTVIAIRNITPDTQQTTSSRPTSLIPLREPPSKTSINASSATRAVRNCPGLSPKVKNVKSKTGGKSRLKTEEGALGRDRAYDPNLCLESKMSSEIQESDQSKNIEITPVDGDESNASCNSSSSCVVDTTISSHVVCDNAPYDQNHFKNDLCSSLSNTDEDFENPSDGVIGHKGAMNLNNKMQKELREIFVSQSDVNCPDNNNFSELSCPKQVYVCGQMDESLNIPSNPAPLLFSPVVSEITASTRIPFAAKNSLNDRDGLLESSKRSTLDVLEKTASHLVSFGECCEGE